MGSLKLSPVLADAAGSLSVQLRLHVEQLARVLSPRAAGLKRRFEKRLERRGFGPRERKALSAITVGAAAEILGRGGSLADFFEQVEYNGRRLAKLQLPPGAVLETLENYDRLIARVLERLPEEARANLRWASEQLAFSAILTLNNAFYQVREAETDAFHELFQAEVECRGQRELLERCVGTLARYCRAEAGILYLADRARSAWLAFAPGGGGGTAAKPDPAVLRRLAADRHIERGRGSGRLLLDPTWSGLYPSCWSIPLNGAGGLHGVLQFGFSKPYEWLPRELEMLRGAAERALLVSEKLRLAEELARSEAQIRQLAANMIEIEERERRRISRELHDEAGQLLPYLRLRLEMLARPLGTPELKAGLAEAGSLVERIVLELRRILSDLSPAVLEQLGLAAAVRQLVSRLRQSHGIEANLRLGRLGTLEKKIELVIYRLVQECCSNIAKHSSASHVNISLAAADGVVRLSVQDDGTGFEAQQAFEKRGSMGLAGMRERVALAGGKLSIEGRPGRGAKITAELPVGTSGARNSSPLHRQAPGMAGRQSGLSAVGAPGRNGAAQPEGVAPRAVARVRNGAPRTEKALPARLARRS